MHALHVNDARLRSIGLVLALSLAALSTPVLAETGEIQSAGVPIHFIDEGEGETVVYLHGFAGSSDLWSAVGLLPLDGFRTIAFDARGHGQSGKPDDQSAYGTELVEDVIRLMDARGVEQAHIVGYSMGAETALKLATEHHDRVLSVVAAGSGWSTEAEVQTYGFVASALSEAATFGDFMVAMAPPGEELSPEMQAAMGELAVHGIDPGQPAAPLAAVAASLPEIIGLDSASLATITVPVLGIAGENDPERPNVEALAEGLPAINVRIIPERTISPPLCHRLCAGGHDLLGRLNPHRSLRQDARIIVARHFCPTLPIAASIIATSNRRRSLLSRPASVSERQTAKSATGATIPTTCAGGSLPSAAVTRARSRLAHPQRIPRVRELCPHPASRPDRAAARP